MSSILRLSLRSLFLPSQQILASSRSTSRNFLAATAVSPAPRFLNSSAVFATHSSRTLFRFANTLRNTISREPVVVKRSGVRFNSTLPPTEKQAATKRAPMKKESRLKELSKKYGWSIVFVYLGLSVLDYPFCFLFVHTLGQDKIGELEDIVIDYLRPVTDKVRDLLIEIGLAKESMLQ